MKRYSFTRQKLKTFVFNLFEIIKLYSKSLKKPLNEKVLLVELHDYNLGRYAFHATRAINYRIWQGKGAI
jgi:hypothetical protein